MDARSPMPRRLTCSRKPCLSRPERRVGQLSLFDNPSDYAAFETIWVEAQAVLDAWRLDYITRHPHSSLGHLTPSEFVSQRQGQPVVKEIVCFG